MARGLIDVFRDWKQNKQDKQELGTETKKEKMLLICNKYRHNKNNKIKDSMVEVLTNPTTHEAVRKILTDDFHTVVFYGSSQIKNEELDILENSCDNIECEFVRLEDYFET